MWVLRYHPSYGGSQTRERGSGSREAKLAGAIGGLEGLVDELAGLAAADLDLHVRLTATLGRLLQRSHLQLFYRLHRALYGRICRFRTTQIDRTWSQNEERAVEKMSYIIRVSLAISFLVFCLTPSVGVAAPYVRVLRSLVLQRKPCC